MRSRTTNTRRTRKRRRSTIERARSTWERLILGMNGTQLERAQVRRMRRLQPLLFTSHPLHQDFNNMSDDDYYSPHICLMAKCEKVKSKSKNKSPPPPSDISSSDISDNSSDDESSDEEINMITKYLDGKTKLFITKLMKDLESVQAKLESREETLI